MEIQRNIVKNTNENKKVQELLEQAESYTQSVSADEDEDQDIQVTQNESQVSDHLKKRNTVDVTGLAMTAMRYEVSNRQAAAITSAYIGDLIRAGILPQDAAYLAVDPDKIQRAKDRVHEDSHRPGK